MKIGCVKEIKNREYRVGLIPDNVKSYVNAGHQVFIERGAGMGSGFTDQEYEKAGAVLLDSAKEVWDGVDMMVKVKEPLPEEYQYFRKDLLLYTYLHLAADRPLTDAMLASGMRGFAYETLIKKDGSIPLLAPMSQIAGRLSIQEGAKYLGCSNRASSRIFRRRIRCPFIRCARNTQGQCGHSRRRYGRNQCLQNCGGNGS